jgi:hypothetical protein
MGNTCASFHVMYRGTTDDAVKAISRAYSALGYERTKKAPADGGKAVIVFAPAGERGVSVFDSTNADLDSGELKDAARAVSKTLKCAALFTSLYDSDSYELVIFSNGRQVDMLMSDAESYEGPLKRLSDKARVTQWRAIFGRALTPEGVARAVGTQSPFADATLAALCGLVGLPAGRVQRNYRDFAEDGETVAAVLHFTKKAVAVPAGPAGEIVLRNYFDKDNSRKLLVYPAAWPTALGREEILTWLMLSEGAGFSGGQLAVDVTGPDGLQLPRGFINGCKFHNGQIVGGYELPSNAPAEVAKAYLETKRFVLTPAPGGVAGARRYVAEFPNLNVPAMTPERTTQILVVLQIYVLAAAAGNWDVKVTLQPRSEPAYVCALPGAAVAAAQQSWVPIVSGLNAKAVYDISDRGGETVPDEVADLAVARLGGQAIANLPPAEARAELARRMAGAHARSYADWLYDAKHKLARGGGERRHEQPAIASNVAILADAGQQTLDVCRAYLEGLLRPLAGGDAEIRVRAERQMTPSLHVGKVKKTFSAAALLEDKAWQKFFDAAADYQALVMEVVPAGAEIPVGGMGFYASLRDMGDHAVGMPPGAATRRVYQDHLLALTLAAMRGRAFDAAPAGGTIHVCNWVINHPDGFASLGTSPGGMTAALDRLVAACPPLQAWHGAATWIPRFDLADDFEATVYEDSSLLNFFRGTLRTHQLGLTDRRMTAVWCGNVLRMVTPYMFLGDNLLGQVDEAALRRVAVVTACAGGARVEKRADCPMDDFELALLPILPIENTRVTAASGGR